MELAIIVAAIFACMALLWFATRNTTTICLLAIENGKITVARGAIAPRVLADMRDVVRRPKVSRASVRIVRSRGRAVLQMSGALTDAQQQQLRNVVGSIPFAKLVNTFAKKK